MYSAVSVDGQRLYDLARKGIEVERKARQVTIFSIEMLSENEESGEYSIAVECSSGTYIRTLIADLGEALGCGAVLTDLRRTKANGFEISKAVTLEELEEAMKNGEIESVLIPVDKALEEYPVIKVSEAQAKRFRNGGELDLQRLKYPRMLGLFRVYDPEDNFIGLGEIGTGDSLTIKRVFVG
jgi:tRNA pseudouridine55 synthase